MRRALLALCVALPFAAIALASAQDTVTTPVEIATAPAEAPELEVASPAVEVPVPTPTSRASPPIPPPSRARPADETDEGGLWGLFDRVELGARSSGRLITDAGLNNYVRDVFCRVAAEQCGDVRLYVMRQPYMNAMMAPNGYSEVWSGLLLRASNESELAYVLGHEVGHFAGNDSLEQMRATRFRMTAAMLLTVGVAIAGVDAASDSPGNAQQILDATGNVIDAIHLATVASLFGFNREQESEADVNGFHRFVAAGYAPSSAAPMWRYEISETAASSNPDVRRHGARSSIFDTHPLSADRADALDELATNAVPTSPPAPDRHRAAIRPFLVDWLRDDLRRRDFGQTLHLLDRLGQHGEDLGVVEYYRGEVHRLRRGDGDRARAKQFYQSAITHADAPAAAWRELGDLEQREGNAAAARAHYTTYLERAPNAEDRALVEARVAQLGEAP